MRMGASAVNVQTGFPVAALKQWTVSSPVDAKNVYLPGFSSQRKNVPGPVPPASRLFTLMLVAVAAPTAGLHFTPELLSAIKNKGVRFANITLHVGYGTFSPVRVDDIRDHDIHKEYVEIRNETAELVNKTRKAGGRVWAVGTTTARALEDAADEDGLVREKEDWCGLYIYPGYKFKVVDNLITNFHLPKSSLLFLVSAMAGYAKVMAAYKHAVKHGYRFYSYGDAMAIVTEEVAGK